MYTNPGVPFEILANYNTGFRMVTGFSIVLWSRLNIIVEDRRIRRGVLAMIFINGVIFHSALVTLQFGLAGAKGSQRAPWLKVLNPLERTQITMFTVQEIIISLFYIHATWRILHDRIVHHRDQTRKVLMMLFVVQTTVVMMDIVIITLDLSGWFTLKAIIHSWVYGIKLELEFVVLNQLVEIARAGVPGLSTITDDSVPDSTQTGSTQNTGSPLPSPDSAAPLAAKQQWWAPPPLSITSHGHTPSIDSVASRGNQSTGLGIIPEREAMQHRTQRTMSLDSIGVIPEP
jgi:hypothetical protein